VKRSQPTLNLCMSLTRRTTRRPRLP